jgi:hypothetical protein
VLRRQSRRVFVARDQRHPHSAGAGSDRRPCAQLGKTRPTPRSEAMLPAAAGSVEGERHACHL